MASEQNLKELKRRYSAQLLSQKGVCGVGIEKDEAGKPVLAIHLDDSSAENLDLPKEFEDYPVKYVQQDGGFRKFSTKTKKTPE
jgi:hypothetical protein